MSGTKISSTTLGSNSSQKAQVFSIKKAGFVIPKNKLAGSLVPVLRGAKKPGLDDAFSSGGETTKHVSRKTKWSPDLTQDPAVRKARALAYQTRVNQITQQLKSGMSETGDPGDTELASQSPDHESRGHEVDSERSEQLELEKREAIGEILKLNPSYKAPPDYKPVLKEDQVSIPVKQYPGYNFVGLIFGPGGDNQKHLEKETGAKIKMFGTKVESGNKVEIKQSDSNNVHDAFEEIHVHVSADTFDKVDAAISVIELLIASVSENLAGAYTTSTSTVANDGRVPLGTDAATLNPVHSSTMQSMPGPTQTLPQGQIGYPNNWFPTGLPNTALHPPPPTSLALALNNPALVANPAPSNMPSLFGPASVPTAGFNLHSQSPSLVTSNSQPPPPPQAFPHPYMAQPSPVSVGPPRNQSPNISAPSMGPNRPSIPPLPQPASSLPQGPIIPVSTGFSNYTQMAPRMVPNHGPHTASTLVTPSNMSTPTLMNASPMGRPPLMLVSSTISPPVPAASGSFVGHSLGSAPLASLSPSMSASGSIANFTHPNPQLLPAPSSGNFSFQALGPRNPVSPMFPRPLNNQLATPNALPPNPMLQSPSPRPPSSQLPVPNFTPQSLNHGFPRPLMGNSMGQPQSHMFLASSPFARNPSRLPGPSGFPAFPDGTGAPRNFGPSPQAPVFPGPRPGNQVRFPQFNNNLPFTPGRPVSTPGDQQLYDPFAPTSMSTTPHQQGGIRRR